MSFLKEGGNKMFKKITVVMLVTVLCVTAGFANGQKENGVLVIKAAHSMPTTYHYHDGMVAFADKAAELSGGKIKIEVYPAAQLGEEVSTMEQCKMGAIPIVLTGVFDSYVPKAGVFILPFLFDNSAHTDAVLNGPIGQKVFAGFEDHNMKVISVWENGFRQITNNVRPINSVADMKGLKLRTPQSPVWMRTMEAFGVTPTPMPFAEVSTAIVQGLVDGQENPLLHIKANKTYEVQKHLAVVDYMYGPAPLLVNKPWFDKLSAENQDIIMKAAAYGNKVMREVAAERNQGAIDFFKSEGLQVTYPDKEGFRALVTDLYNGEWADKFGKDLLTEIQNAKY